MILSIKHWQSIVHKNTGEPLGIMCYECFEPVKDHLHFQEGKDLENIKDNMFMTCMCCSKMVNEDYSVCGECLEIYPKNFDSRVDNGMKCTCCAYGI